MTHYAVSQIVKLIQENLHDPITMMSVRAL